MTAPAVRVLVVDDQAPFRLAARAVVRRAEGFDLVGEAATGEEAVALKAVFNGKGSQIPVTSIKSMLGESLGASGALQAVSSILTLIEGIIPPTLNFEECDSSWGLQGLSHQAQHQEVEVAMINSLNCDGNNASLLLGHHDYNRK